ncbi:XRE family transcriptional regulator [Streptomyces roseifaciens]|uniref:XRE family transcriptional regulator n=1 Tax=Streptomyces roseifaciens TaxID=1488406 RepID=UPI000B1DD089|nr:XRE family transcriptional regulator [Streptomyces roseifaciens]
MARLLQLAEDQGMEAPRINADQLRLWESDQHQPRETTVKLLCWLYDGPLSLGLRKANTLPEPGQRLAATMPVPADAPSPLAGLTSHHLALLPDPVGDRIEAKRRSLNRTLAMATVSADQLDDLDESIRCLRRQYLYTAPVVMLQALFNQLDEVEGLSAERQPGAVQVRLSEMTALLATLMADALMKLGRLERSRAWYDTAQNAADDSGILELRARVRAQRAMFPYYYGPLTDAVSLTRDAGRLARGYKGRPTATEAFAAAAEARALARQGNTSAAEAAIRYARQTFEQCDPGPDDDAFSFPARRLLFYLSGAYTALGHTSQARRVQEEALSLYPARTGIDPALLRLEAAICLANDRSPTEACQLATATYLQVPAEHRTPILEERARHVIEVLPPAIGGGPAARELTEILALPAADT